MNDHTTATYDALVDLARSLRPTWHTEGVRAAIRQALARDPMPHLADLAYALTRCAIDPTIATPAILPLDGPHWRHQYSTDAGGPRITVKARCDECGGLHAPEAPHNARPAEDEREPAHPKAAEARALLRSQRLSLCPCGTRPRDCADHRKETA